MTETLKALSQRMLKAAEHNFPAQPANVTALIEGYEKKIADDEDLLAKRWLRIRDQSGHLDTKSAVIGDMHDELASLRTKIEGYDGEIDDLKANSVLLRIAAEQTAKHRDELQSEIASLRDQLAAWREAVLYRQPHGEDWLQQDIDWKYREQLKQCQEGK